MRLSKAESEIIKADAIKVFGPGVKVYLFGSRVDDEKKGGDIDLYIVPKTAGDLYDKKIRFLIQLDQDIGEQKIDVVIAKDKKRLIEQEAVSKGIQL